MKGYIIGFNYSKQGLERLIEREQDKARFDAIMSMSEDHKELLREGCNHDGKTYEITPHNCYHKIYCLQCGQLIAEYDSSD
jgi:hypothetical protein